MLIRLSDEETILIKAYARMNGISVSQLVRDAVFNKIEEEYDIKAYDEAIAEYEKRPLTFSLEEIEKSL